MVPTGSAYHFEAWSRVGVSLLDIGAASFGDACALVRASARHLPLLFVIGWDTANHENAAIVVAGVRVRRLPLRLRFRRKLRLSGVQTVRRPAGTCGMVIGRHAEGDSLISVTVRHVDGSVGLYRADELEPVMGQCGQGCVSQTRGYLIPRLFRRHRPKCSHGKGVRGLCTD